MGEREVQELRAQIAERDQQIKELQGRLSKADGKSSFRAASARSSKAKPPVASVSASGAQVKSPGRNVPTAFRKLSGAKPANPYSAADPNDLVDVRLEEFYNGTGSHVPFRRINRGFYRF